MRSAISLRKFFAHDRSSRVLYSVPASATRFVQDVAAVSLAADDAAGAFDKRCRLADSARKKVVDLANERSLMPRFKPDTLRLIGYQLFEAAGCSPEDARFVANHLVESNLFGHDSHGVIRYIEYIQAIRDGRFQVQGSARIIRESACTAVVDGGAALGQLGGRFAMQLAEKAREHGLGAVGCEIQP